MTLNVNFSIDQNQAYGVVIESYTQLEGGARTESELEASLQPGECAVVVMWDTKILQLTEIPKVAKQEYPESQ